MIAHDLAQDKWRSEDIKIKGDESITFEQLHLKQGVLNGLKKCGFVTPSPIQLQAIPLGRCGVDVIAQSKSGTGKTCVFVVIALEMICLESSATQVLIVAPTREIANQIGNVVNALSSGMEQKVKCCTVIGGTKVKEDKENLSEAHIVVGTPGRINHLIEIRLIKTNAIRLLVFDEVDKLLEENFKKQIDSIFSNLSENKQMIATSATMSNELAKFLSFYMRTPAFVRLNSDNPSLIGVTQFYLLSEPHHENHVNFDNKIHPLIGILEKISFSQCIIFSNYQTRARMLCDKLNNLNWPSAYISSEKSQQERQKAISKLKKFKCRVLVSTDLTSRGIDIESVNLVINMDVPWELETYLHRVGRAGRFGSQGVAITIVSRGREFDGLQKIFNECKLSINELPNPIPDDIWSKTKTDLFVEKDNSLDAIDSPEITSEFKQSENESEKVNLVPYIEIVKRWRLFSENYVQPKEPIKYKFTSTIKEPNLEFSINDMNEHNEDIDEEYHACQKNSQPCIPNDLAWNCVPANQVNVSRAFFPSIFHVNNSFNYTHWMRHNLCVWRFLLNPNTNYMRTSQQ